MGHVTVDRLDDAWHELSKAEHYVENGHTHSGVMHCKEAVDRVYQSAKGMDYSGWIADRQVSVREDIGSLSMETEPDAEKVAQLIEDCRKLVRQTAKKVIPELHSRIDYEPTPSRFDVEF